MKKKEMSGSTVVVFESQQCYSASEAFTILLGLCFQKLFHKW